MNSYYFREAERFWKKYQTTDPYLISTWRDISTIYDLDHSERAQFPTSVDIELTRLFAAANAAVTQALDDFFLRLRSTEQRENQSQAKTPR